MHTVKYKNGTIVSKSNDQKENAANNGMMQEFNYFDYTL